jgi:amino-acid N-acetyltransferase
MNITHKPPEADVKKLLASAQLPTIDITPEHLEHFFGVWVDSSLEGVVGLELFGSVALLRSLAVVASKRSSGLGTALLARAEQYAVEKGVRSIFLLTTTAEPYFRKRGYSPLLREAAPEAVQKTAEFTSICPASSEFMVKFMPANSVLNLTRGADAPLAG